MTSLCSSPGYVLRLIKLSPEPPKTLCSSCHEAEWFELFQTSVPDAPHCFSRPIWTKTKACSTAASMQITPYWLLHSFSAVLVLSIMHSGMLAISPLAICTYLCVCVCMKVCVPINLVWYQRRSCWGMQDASIKQTWVSLGRQRRDNITHA